MADITGAFEVDGLVRQKAQLEAMLMGNPAMEKKVQGLIRKVLSTARREVSNAAKASMQTDPRQAYKAVKSAVYKRILGGNISLLNARRAGQRLPAPPIYHKLEHTVNSKGNHRGGNRMPRSRRTEELLTYAGKDRAFILRFISQGTNSRRSSVGNRGHIAPRNFFASASEKALQEAAIQLDSLIEELIKKEMN